MMHIRKISTLIIGLLLLTIIAGCGMVQVNPEKDRVQVVAKIKDETILKGQVLDILSRDKEHYGITEEDIEGKGNNEQVHEIKKLILNQLVVERLLVQKASEAGFVVDDEMIKEAQEELADIKKGLEEQLKLSAGLDEEGSEERDYAREAEEYFENQLETLGKTEEEYIEYLAEHKCIEKLYDETLKDVKVSQEEIEEYYNEELEKQKDNPGSGVGSPVTLYEPDRVRTKHILIEIPEDKAQEYKDLLNDEKEAEAEKLLEEELKKIEKKAQDALAEAKEEKDFIKLVKKINPDSVDAMEEGITIHRANSFLPDEYIEEAFKLEEGDVSGLIKTSNGYYIIKLEEELPEVTFALEDTKDEIEKVVEKNKKEEKWVEIVEDWQEKDAKKFEKRL